MAEARAEHGLGGELFHSGVENGDRGRKCIVFSLMLQLTRLKSRYSGLVTELRSGEEFPHLIGWELNSLRLVRHLIRLNSEAIARLLILKSRS